MILTEKFYPFDKNNQDIFFVKLGHFFFIFKKGRRDFFQLVAGLYWSIDNTKKLTLGFYLQIPQKWIAITIRQSSLLLFFFCASNCLFRVFIYLTPISFISLTVLFLFLSFLHPKSLLFNERIWYCITFSQLEGRCNNCNPFYEPYNTEGCKCKNRAALPSNWYPQSLYF